MGVAMVFVLANACRMRLLNPLSVSMPDVAGSLIAVTSYFVLYIKPRFLA